MNKLKCITTIHEESKNSEINLMKIRNLVKEITNQRLVISNAKYIVFVEINKIT
jgi:hypothetical protein